MLVYIYLYIYVNTLTLCVRGARRVPTRYALGASAHCTHARTTHILSFHSRDCGWAYRSAVLCSHESEIHRPLLTAATTATTHEEHVANSNGNGNGNRSSTYSPTHPHTQCTAVSCCCRCCTSTQRYLQARRHEPFTQASKQAQDHGATKAPARSF